MLNRWLRIGAYFIAGVLPQLPLIREAAAEPYSAEEMLTECQSLLSSAKKTEDPDAIELDNTFATGSCWGAFLSIQQLVTIKKAGAKNMVFRVCVPQDTTLVQIIQISMSMPGIILNGKTNPSLSWRSPHCTTHFAAGERFHLRPHS